ncbi:DUF3180 domain-containing protein [Corynebacterium tapiri]|uniref:DUF3180 domain-containing protein n=1 Tax=Corynebacterium tapiri TaxID=1448266 RepID=A0A5C4U1X5_9CORY|nr:DUF3180 domain-containing protein [Corynebacterium tapiri]TNL96040.1 DUF3180 domain-containing protein [Corynebacterium tapiri]
MTTTRIPALLATWAFITAAVAMIAWRLYGYLPPVQVSGAVTLWLLAVVVVVLVVVVRASISEEHRIGLDRTQLNPMTIARMMVVGKAAAWTGAIMAGGYSGLALYLVPKLQKLAAAGDELPIVIAGLIGAVVLGVAGVVLERHCQTPPPTDASPAT